MTINFKKLALAALALSGISLTALSLTSAPAAARVVCDRDGDDCRRVPDYYGGYGDTYDGDWRRREEWRERHEWQERREHEAYRDWYWSRPYYRDRPASSFYFSF